MHADAARALFRERFSGAPLHDVRAPGRVNLIGEHTDYNEGFVLPCAIDRAVVACAAQAVDGRVVACSRELPEPVEIGLPGLERRGPGWGRYLHGVLAALQEFGAPIGGCRIALASDLPHGAGLASSAALCAALVRLCDALYGLQLDPLSRARLAHRAESHFVGVGCGIMDPWICVFGRRGAALRLDCRSESIEHVALPTTGLALLVVDSGVRHALAEGDYGDRLGECRTALRELQQAGLLPSSAQALRDFDPAALGAAESRLTPRSFRRLRHVLSENERVEAVVAALRRADPAAAGRWLDAGMRSLQADYEVSRPELDALCAIAADLPGVLGSRLTGAGFGGCTLHFVEPAAREGVEAALLAGFAARFGRRPRHWWVESADGAELL